jgi:hypothetical protein
MSRFTSSGVTRTPSHSSNGILVEVVPMMHTVSPGDEDVGVRGLAAAVDDDAVHAVREDE